MDYKDDAIADAEASGWTVTCHVDCITYTIRPHDRYMISIDRRWGTDTYNWGVYFKKSDGHVDLELAGTTDDIHTAMNQSTDAYEKDNAWRNSATFYRMAYLGPDKGIMIDKIGDIRRKLDFHDPIDREIYRMYEESTMKCQKNERLVHGYWDSDGYHNSYCKSIP